MCYEVNKIKKSDVKLTPTLIKRTDKSAKFKVLLYMNWTTEFTSVKSMFTVCEIMNNIEVKALLRQDIKQINVMTPIVAL